MTLIIVAAIAIVGVIGLTMVLSGLGVLTRGKIATAGGRMTGGLLIAALAASAGLLGYNVRAYQRLTVERPVALVELRQDGAQLFEAVLTRPGDDGAPAAQEVFALRGDAVRLEARVVKLKPFAVIAGADTFYRLDRISGRYDDVVQGRAEPPSLFDLAEDLGVDVAALPFGLSERVVRDVAFGSGAFAPMIDGAVYEFRLTEDAMIVRGYNELGRRALRERA